MNITIHRDGQNYGPYGLEEARRHLAAGSFTPTDLALIEGSSEWTTLNLIPGVTTSSPLPPPPPRLSRPAPPPPSSSPPPPPPPLTPASLSPSVPHKEPVSKTSSLAIWAMICGLLSFFSIYFHDLAPADKKLAVLMAFLLVAVAAAILGHRALDDVERNPAMSGRGMAVSGLVLGYLWGMFLVAGIFVDITHPNEKKAVDNKLENNASQGVSPTVNASAQVPIPSSPARSETTVPINTPVNPAVVASIPPAPSPPPENSPPAGAVTNPLASKIIGSWQGTRHINTYLADGRYGMDVDTTGEYYGHWSLSGNTLTTTYGEDSKPIVLSNVVVSDTELSFDSLGHRFTERRVSDKPTPVADDTAKTNQSATSVVVDTVLPESNFDHLGIMSGDSLRSVDGIPVTDSDKAMELVRSRNMSASVILVIVHHGTESKIKVPPQNGLYGLYLADQQATSTDTRESEQLQVTSSPKPKLPTNTTDDASLNVAASSSPATDIQPPSKVNTPNNLNNPDSSATTLEDPLKAKYDSGLNSAKAANLPVIKGIYLGMSGDSLAYIINKDYLDIFGKPIVIFYKNNDWDNYKNYGIDSVNAQRDANDTSRIKFWSVTFSRCFFDNNQLVSYQTGFNGTRCIDGSLSKHSGNSSDDAVALLAQALSGVTVQASFTFDNNNSLIDLKWGHQLVDSLFNVSDMDAEHFVTSFGNNYGMSDLVLNIKIDEGQPSPLGTQFDQPPRQYWDYSSPDGFELFIEKDKSIHLKLTPKAEQRSFN